jgi:hypothetical protein
MTRTSIMLPNPLKSRVARRAKGLGMTVEQFIRHSLEQSAPSQPRRPRKAVLKLDIYKGPGPSDVSQNVDEYLYGAKRDFH